MHTPSNLGSTLAVPLVIWDVDRTLTAADTLIPFLRRVVGPAQWTAVCRQAAVETALNGASRAYLKSCLLRRSLAGLDYGETLAEAYEFARTVHVQGCRVDSLTRWAWHRDRGDVLVLASASPGLYLEPLGESLGATHVLATELEVHDGAFTGAIDGANCRGHEKARRISDLITAVDPGPVWVYSDSHSDRPSLTLADIPTRVRPWRTIPDLTRTSPLGTRIHVPGGTP